MSQDLDTPPENMEKSRISILRQDIDTHFYPFLGDGHKILRLCKILICVIVHIFIKGTLDLVTLQHLDMCRDQNLSPVLSQLCPFSLLWDRFIYQILRLHMPLTFSRNFQRIAVVAGIPSYPRTKASVLLPPTTSGICVLYYPSHIILISFLFLLTNISPLI